MKKLLLLLAGGAIALSGAAAEGSPLYFSESFGSGSVPSDWIQYGVDATPEGDYSADFADYSPSDAFIVYDVDGQTFASSPCEFAGEAVSDQWLITPEITIGDSPAMVSFTVALLDTKSRNKYKVLLSEGGTAKEDFTTSLLTTTITGKGTQASTAGKRLTIEGYEGKTIRLAFVNYDNSTGLMGFTDIRADQYDLIYDASTVSKFVLENESVKPEFTVKLSTPVTCDGLTAVLEAGDYTSTFTTTQGFSNGMWSSCLIKFPDVFSSDIDLIPYTLTITPNFEGAKPTVIDGSFVRPVYPGVAVIEEFTGSWCGWCTRGAAFMNYFKENFGMAEGKGRFIGIAVHGSDVMTPPYYNELTSLISVSGYPYAFINRAEGGDPSAMNVTKWQDTKTLASAKIGRVGYDSASRTLDVTYGVATCFDTNSPDLGVSCYVIENGVQGTGEGYAQANNYYSYTSSQIRQQFGEALVPYFQPFIGQSGPYIAADKMSFNDVARSATPSVFGEKVKDSMTAFVYNVGTMKVQMPASVKKPENTELIVLVTDNMTNHIIAADVVPYEKFNEEIYLFTDEPVYPEDYDPSGVETVFAGCDSLRFEEGRIVAETLSGGLLSVYSSDGQLLSETRLAGGVSRIRPVGEGLLIVRLATEEGVRTLKVIL